MPQLQGELLVPARASGWDCRKADQAATLPTVVGGREKRGASGRARSVGRGLLTTRSPRLRRTGALAGASVLTVLGLAACTSSPKPPTTIPPVTSTTDAPTTTVPPSTTTTTVSPAGQVLASWKQDETDYYVADEQYPVSYLNPLLTQGFAPPLLYDIRQNFAAYQHFGWVGPKTYHVWPIKVLSLTPTKAVVEGCTYDTGEKVRATGKPVPGELGTPGFGLFLATMIPDKSGPSHWLITGQKTANTTNTEGPCKGLNP